MNQGRVDQIGTPREVYESPATLFVADFLGGASVMRAEAGGSNGAFCSVRVGEFELRAGCGDLGTRGAASVVIRPERLEVIPHSDRPGENFLPGMVDRTVFVGSNLQVMVRLVTGEIVQASIPNHGNGLEFHEQGKPVMVHAPAETLRVLAVPRNLD